jgi:CSLREA domain-containing protein
MHTRSYLAALALLLALGCRDDAESPSGPTASNPNESLSSTAAGHKVVNSVADPGNGVCNAQECTLREAIEDPTSTEITFASGLSGPITLAGPGHGGGSLLIDKPLSITGPASGLLIRRSSSDPAFRILRVDPNGEVRLENLSLNNGRSNGDGGGILNFGKLTISRSTLSNNSAADRGGGIDNHGTLGVSNSTITKNSAHESAGIDNHKSGTLELTSSTVTDNSGTGVVNGGGTITVRNSTVSLNSGDGISGDFGSNTLRFIQVLDNTARGISFYKSHVTLANSTVARNQHGGIVNTGGSFSVSKSAIVANSSSDPGGGIHNTVGDAFGRGSSELTLTNSTVARNSAPSGAGIFNGDRLGTATVRVINSTIAFNTASNSGGGIRQEGASENGNVLSLVNSIVARNSAPTGPDVSDRGDEGSFVSASFTLIGDGTGSGIANSDGNKVGKVAPHSGRIDPRLGSLALHGGATRNYSLLAGSPAIDAASSDGCPARDQRDVTRPQGAACDMGSFERQ